MQNFASLIPRPNKTIYPELPSLLKVESNNILKRWSELSIIENHKISESGLMSTN